jgi:hypothetical protein
MRLIRNAFAPPLTMAPGAEAPVAPLLVRLCQRAPKSPPPVPVLSQIIPVHILTPYFLKLNFNIIFPSTPRYSEWSLCFRLAGTVPLKYSTSASFDILTDSYLFRAVLPLQRSPVRKWNSDVSFSGSRHCRASFVVNSFLPSVLIVQIGCEDVDLRQLARNSSPLVL